MDSPIPVLRCRNCSRDDTELEWCATCNTVKYCSDRCRLLDKRRHRSECTAKPPLMIPKAYADALQRFLDPSGIVNKLAYHFLLIRIVRREGSMFVVPLLDKSEGSISDRLGYTELGAYAITWACSGVKRRISDAAYFMYVLDENNWRNCIPCPISSTIPPDQEEVASIESEMHKYGFLEGSTSVILASDNTVRVVALKDVAPDEDTHK